MPKAEGSRPESMAWDRETTWTARNFTQKEVEATPDGKWRPKTFCGMPDPKQAVQAFRRGYDAIDWSAHGGKKNDETKE